ncbi:hypothetical protein F4677DRAFT_400169 [Hypoxylon crocopeplum]|nr:hypothetical protein F4677DRAFT_400169 [Hypoxylon crocopeplum]
MDVVIINGKTMAEFSQHTCKIHVTIPIVIRASDIQFEAIYDWDTFNSKSCGYLCLVVLHFSVGRGATNTGNRFFNTTDLP